MASWEMKESYSLSSHEVSVDYLFCAPNTGSGTLGNNKGSTSNDCTFGLHTCICDSVLSLATILSGSIPNFLRTSCISGNCEGVYGTSSLTVLSLRLNFIGDVKRRMVLGE